MGGSISAFAIDSTGGLMPLPGAPFAAGEGPTAIAADPSGRFLFVAEDQSVPGARGSNCNGFNSVLLSQRVDGSSGALTKVDRKVLDGVCARAVAVDPSGKYVYVAMGRAADSQGEIAAFSMGPSGMLIPLPGSPLVLASGVPTGLAMHRSGKFVHGASNGGLLILDRNPSTGALTGRGAFNTPKQRLALNPAGTFLVAAEMGSNEISEFHVDPNTGDITATEGRAQALKPFGVAADPLGAFFGVTEITDTTTLGGGVSTFALNSDAGELEKTGGSPFPAGHGVIDLTFDPNGTHVFAINRQDGSISSFTLGRTSGALTASGSPVRTGDFPDALVVVKPQ